MSEPKISVLIPMYNRKHYIEDCINSVLNQTFQDFEIIIRDNCSTDGSFEFVAEKYSQQIATGKIKLIRNERNVGLFKSSNNLMFDAQGKYIKFLHSDDLLVIHALQHLYEIAEKTNADVVHECYLLQSEPDGIIDMSKLHLNCWETNPVKVVSLISDNPMSRFKEWYSEGTFHDVMYNLLRRKFMLDNNIFFKYDYKFTALEWTMFAKIFVKTPTICYIRRNAPDSGARNKQATDLANFISRFITLPRDMDELFTRIEFFKNNEEIQYMAKAYLLKHLDKFFVFGSRYYENGITKELWREVDNMFKKYFGENYFYPALLFNWIHAMPFNKPVDIITNPVNNQPKK